MKTVLALVFLATGCKPECKVGFIGDATLAPEAVMVVTDGKPSYDEVHDSDVLPLEYPVQGGEYVLYVGVKVRNMSGCNLKLSARMVDPRTTEEIAFDGRSADVIAQDGWILPDVRSVTANLPNPAPCPNRRDPIILGPTFNLEITATDQERSVTVTHPVTLACGATDPDHACPCYCAPHYFEGKCGGDAKF